MKNYRHQQCGCFNCQHSKMVEYVEYNPGIDYYCQSNSPAPDLQTNKEEWCKWIINRLVDKNGICDDYLRDPRDLTEKECEYLSERAV